MSNTFRALCAELTAALHDWQCETADDRYADLIDYALAALAQPEPPELTDKELWELYELERGEPGDWSWVRDYARAAIAADRAALAQPELAPTDEGIPQWSEGVCGDGAAILRDGVMIPIEELVALLNRAERLSRWGCPTIKPVPPTNEELDTWWKKCADLTREGKADCYWAFGDVTADYVYSIARAAIAADRARRHANQPVPVSERLPGPEDWDTNGRCWMFDPCDRGWWAYRSALPSDDELGRPPWTHWLPHNALPTPEASR